MCPSTSSFPHRTDTAVQARANGVDVNSGCIRDSNFVRPVFTFCLKGLCTHRIRATPFFSNGKDEKACERIRPLITSTAVQSEVIPVGKTGNSEARKHRTTTRKASPAGRGFMPGTCTGKARHMRSCTCSRCSAPHRVARKNSRLRDNAPPYAQSNSE